MSQEKLTDHEVCQGCQATLATPLFCFSCQLLQRQKPQLDYFKVFDLPYKYDVDLQKLEEIYQNLAVELHPDFYTNAPKDEQRQSQESASLLNKAYNTLKSPTDRAPYLLNILTHDKKQNDRLLPDGFLQEMFLLQESLEELLNMEGSPDDSKQAECRPNEITIFQNDIEKRLKQSHDIITKLFSSMEERPSDTKSSYEEVQVNLNVGHYLQRLLNRISRSEVL